MSGSQWKNERLNRVISGLEHHGGIAEWRCWQDDVDIIPTEYCPYFEENECVTQLTKDALELLKEYDIALRMMVYQYCTAQKQFLKGKDCDLPNQEVFFHSFMSAGEEAFRVLGIENGQEVTDDFIWS